MFPFCPVLAYFGAERVYSAAILRKCWTCAARTTAHDSGTRDIRKPARAQPAARRRCAAAPGNQPKRACSPPGLSRTTVDDARRRPPGARHDRRAGGRSHGPIWPRPPACAPSPRCSVGAALGIDFGHRHVRAAVADLSSTVLAERYMVLEVDDDADGARRGGRPGQRGARRGGDRSQPPDRRRDGALGPIDRDTGTVASTVVPGWPASTRARALATSGGPGRGRQRRQPGRVGRGFSGRAAGSPTSST